MRYETCFSCDDLKSVGDRRKEDKLLRKIIKLKIKGLSLFCHWRIYFRTLDFGRCVLQKRRLAKNKFKTSSLTATAVFAVCNVVNL